jgi:hypothetical protein
MRPALVIGVKALDAVLIDARAFSASRVLVQSVPGLATRAGLKIRAFEAFRRAAFALVVFEVKLDVAVLGEGLVDAWGKLKALTLDGAPGALLQSAAVLDEVVDVRDIREVLQLIDFDEAERALAKLRESGGVRVALEAGVLRDGRALDANRRAVENVAREILLAKRALLVEAAFGGDFIRLRFWQNEIDAVA